LATPTANGTSLLERLCPRKLYLPLLVSREAMEHDSEWYDSAIEVDSDNDEDDDEYVMVGGSLPYAVY
jgi:hypothetical protein